MLRKTPYILAMLVLLALVFTSPGSILGSNQNVATATPNPKDLTICQPGNAITRIKTEASVSGDKKTDLLMLTIMKQLIDTQLLACTGLNFKGTLSMKLIGPFDLPAGEWKATLTTPGFAIMQMKVINGSCSLDGGFGDFLYNITGGQATDGAEILMKSGGCTIAIQPSNISAPWTLSFVPFDTEVATPDSSN